MDDEVCCVCGKSTQAGRLYCSDVCQDLDSTSPSMSSSSSPQTSPRQQPYQPQPIFQIPPLVRGALGGSGSAAARREWSSSASSSSSEVSSSLEDHHDDTLRQRQRHFHVSSAAQSPASATAAALHLSRKRRILVENLPSAFADDGVPTSRSHGYRDTQVIDPSIVTNNHHHVLPKSPILRPQHSDSISVNEYSVPLRHPAVGMQFSRRPSATNNRSTIPTFHQHRRTPSNNYGSPLAHSPPPIPPKQSYPSYPAPTPAAQQPMHKEASDAKKAARASLPAYFQRMIINPSGPTSNLPPAPSELSRTSPITEMSLPRSGGPWSMSGGGTRGHVPSGGGVQVAARGGGALLDETIRASRSPVIRGAGAGMGDSVESMHLARGRATTRRNSSPAQRPVLLDDEQKHGPLARFMVKRRDESPRGRRMSMRERM